MREVACAGHCGTMMSPVDGHAVGWRPMCEKCRIAGRTWWYYGYGTGEVARVYGPLKENFGKNPETGEYILPMNVVKQVLKKAKPYEELMKGLAARGV